MSGGVARALLWELAMPGIRSLRGLAVALVAAPHLALPAAAQGSTDAPAWTAEQLIEALDVSVDPEITFDTRGLRPGEGVAKDPAVGSGVVADLRVLFPFDSADLTPEAKRILDELAGALQSERLRAHAFRIAGHTDAVGDEAYNLDLSSRRARAVVDYLTQTHGISRARLVAEGFGERQLFRPEQPRDGANRRVEVVNLAAGGG